MIVSEGRRAELGSGYAWHPGMPGIAAAFGRSSVEYADRHQGRVSGVGRATIGGGEGVARPRKWDEAYYLAGYAVELALKACIIKRLMETDAFPDREFSKNCYTHAIEKLVVLAGLDGPRKSATDADPELLAMWSTARDWSEEKRYHRIDESEAKELYAAIADAAHGVLPWIKAQW
jgi:HEPN domain-containing protein